MLTLFNLAFPQVCITTQSKQIQLGDRVVCSEGPSQMVWMPCQCEDTTFSKEEILSSEQLLGPERRMFPEERVGNLDRARNGRGKGSEQRQAEASTQSPALSCPPGHSSQEHPDAPRAAPWIIEIMRRPSLRQLPSTLYELQPPAKENIKVRTLSPSNHPHPYHFPNVLLSSCQTYIFTVGRRKK